MLFGYKVLYEQEKARADRLELQLRQLNDTIRTDSIRNLADAQRALKVAAETIASLRRAVNEQKP